MGMELAKVELLRLFVNVNMATMERVVQKNAPVELKTHAVGAVGVKSMASVIAQVVLVATVLAVLVILKALLV